MITLMKRGMSQLAQSGTVRLPSTFSFKENIGSKKGINHQKALKADSKSVILAGPMLIISLPGAASLNVKNTFCRRVLPF